MVRLDRALRGGTAASGRTPIGARRTTGPTRTCVPRGATTRTWRAWRSGAAHADARVDRDAAIGKREHGIHVELGNLGQIVGETSEAKEEVRESTCVRGGTAAETTNEAPGLTFYYKLVRVRVREGSDPERSLADQLRKDAARPECDQRTEDRVLHHPGEELRTTANHGLHDDRAADPRRRVVHGDGVGEVESDVAELGLVLQPLPS